VGFDESYILGIFGLLIYYMGTIFEIGSKKKQAFKSLFNDFFPLLVLFVDRYLNDEDKSADVAQESFIRLWKSSNKFDSNDKRKSFLYTTARNICLNEFRHDVVVDEHNTVVKCLDSDIFFRDNIIEEETYSLVYSAIDKLAPQSKKIILLSLRGYGNIEIAEELNISVNTVRTLKQNAYKKLKGILHDYFYLITVFF